MSGWAAKRFWKQAEAVAAEGGFTVQLDSHAVRTPAKASLIVPTESLAQDIAAEWNAQKGEIAPATMPATRMANAAIDKVAVQHAEVAEMLAGYGDSDLLCYRAATPAELVERQADAWDPLLDWASDTLGVHLVPVTGVIHAPQSEDAKRALSRLVHGFSPFELAAFHDLVALPGSLIIGFAASRQAFDVQDLWNRSRVDEIWQQEQWGSDEEAAEQAELKKQAFASAERFFRLCR